MSPSDPTDAERSIPLDDGATIGVIGGGAAGSLFSIFCLTLAERTGLEISLELIEPKDFTVKGPSGCNNCGGIISESLVQMLATEGINLPDTVVQRGIDAYVLHTDAGSVRIDTPLQEKRIAAVHRGAGPRGTPDSPWRSFDGYLQELAVNKGAKVRQDMAKDVTFEDGRPVVSTRDGETLTYDLLVVATGINSASLKRLQGLHAEYKIPKTAKTMIREYYLGTELISRNLGDSMHLFLLDVPRLEFAAIIPKGDCASLCMMGDGVDKTLLESLLGRGMVQECLRGVDDGIHEVCGCAPKINTAGAEHPFANRVVFIGDAGVTRLYKDGIGAAYRTAKAAALSAVFHGVGASDFRRYYLPACRRIARDNMYGRFVFFVTEQIRKFRIGQRAVVRMVAHEQADAARPPRMSTVLWDTFTGSAAYKDILLRACHPLFVLNLFRHVVMSVFGSRHDSAEPAVQVAVESSRRPS